MTTMDAGPEGRRSPRGGWFVALWILGAALAVPAGRILGDSLVTVLFYPALIVATIFLPARQSANLDGFELIELAGYVSTMVGIALTVGLAQWLVLYGHSQRLKWWWPATSAGLTLGALLNIGYRSHLWSLLGDSTTGLMSLDILGLVVGGAQGLVLRRQGYRTGWWVLASAVGWQLGFLARRWSHGLIATPAFQALPDLLLGAVAGLITGAALVRLLRSSATVHDTKRCPAVGSMHLL